MNSSDWKMRVNLTLDEKTGCLEWNKYCLPAGYGRTRYMGKNMLTHRLAWLLAHPEDERMILDNPRQLVCHSCDNPPCCNPAHLFLGSHKDNTQDALGKGHLHVALETMQEAGRHQRIRRFTHEQIDAIRAAEGTLAQVAAKFGCSDAYVSMLRNGKRKTAPRR